MYTGSAHYELYLIKSTLIRAGIEGNEIEKERKYARRQMK
jgi:hypothetical protein